MSTNVGRTITALAGGLRIIRVTQDDVELDVNSQFTVHIPKCERVIQPLVISSELGYIAEIAEALWVGKTGFPAAAGPNDLVVTVRCCAAVCNPHGVEAAYTEVGDWEIIVIVH